MGLEFSDDDSRVLGPPSGTKYLPPVWRVRLDNELRTKPKPLPPLNNNRSNQKPTHAVEPKEPSPANPKRNNIVSKIFDV